MSLKENIQLFEDNKIDIISSWINKKSVLNILNKYDIKKDIFIKNYAVGILNYYIGVVNNTNTIGDCPVIDKFLEFLKEKNIRSEELFILCSGFKNALISFTYSHNINTQQINEDINYIYEQNFTGVLHKYSQTIKETTTQLRILDKIIDKNVIMSTTDIKGNILSASSAFCQISGYSEDDLLGQPHSIMRHHDMPSEIFSEMWKTIKSGKTWKGEVKNLTKNGGYYWVYATITPNLDDNGTIVSYTSIRQDITSKKEVEEQQDIIVEQSKTTAMGEMIAMLAHQWRQPLQIMAVQIQQLPLEKMMEGEISDKTLENVINGTQNQLDYMSKTITDFSDFFRANKTKELVLVSQLIERAREIVAYTLKTDGITLNIKGDDCEISTHLIEVAQVIINLMKNAHDILVERDTEDKIIDIDYYKENNNIVIEVKDNAGGIPEDILPKIFEPYFTTKNIKNGSGLGLYSSKTLIEKQADGILIATNGTAGAIFKIILPIN